MALFFFLGVFMFGSFITVFAVVKAVMFRTLQALKPFIMIWDWILTTNATTHRTGGETHTLPLYVQP
jgi:hypothetical protein